MNKTFKLGELLTNKSHLKERIVWLGNDEIFLLYDDEGQWCNETINISNRTIVKNNLIPLKQKESKNGYR